VQGAPGFSLIHFHEAPEEAAGGQIVAAGRWRVRREVAARVAAGWRNAMGGQMAKPRVAIPC
jgi:hypothetical protein